MVPAHVLERKPIEYPGIAKQTRASGTVVLTVNVAPDGTATEAKVTRSDVSPPLLAAAVNSVRRWRFAPAMLNGKPVEGVVEIKVLFKSAE